MLHLLFNLGPHRYALPAGAVVRVIPRIEMRPLPLAPDYVAGLIHYRGQIVPVIDLCALVLGRHAECRLSTRIILTEAQNRPGAYLGLIAEAVTETVSIESGDFRETGIAVASAPYLGPMARTDEGLVQRIDLQTLLPETVRHSLFAPEVAHP